MGLIIDQIVDNHFRDVRELLTKILKIAERPDITKEQVVDLLKKSIKIYE